MPATTNEQIKKNIIHAFSTSIANTYVKRGTDASKRSATPKRKREKKKKKIKKRFNIKQYECYFNFAVFFFCEIERSKIVIYCSHEKSTRYIQSRSLRRCTNTYDERRPSEMNTVFFQSFVQRPVNDII